MILHGRNLIIKVGGVAIAAAKSCDINVQCEETETASPSTGAWRTAITGRKSWSVTTNQLVTSLVRPLQIVGTSVSLSMEMEGKVGLQFGGFVDNVVLESGTINEGDVQSISWDKTRKKFVYEFFLVRPPVYSFYGNWLNDTKYKNISNGQLFYDDNFKVYSYYNGDLHAEKMTGTANVVAWRPQGTVGNLAQGSFQFKGNGALTAASLPST